jgi:hypothetical protein
MEICRLNMNLENDECLTAGVSRCYVSPHPLTPRRRLGDTDRYAFPQQVQQATGGAECVAPVTSEKFLMLVEQCVTELGLWMISSHLLSQSQRS